MKHFKDFKKYLQEDMTPRIGNVQKYKLYKKDSVYYIKKELDKDYKTFKSEEELIHYIEVGLLKNAMTDEQKKQISLVDESDKAKYDILIDFEKRELKVNSEAIRVESMTKK